MRIALVGKGGSGKTTLAGILARQLARDGWEVVALDCDANPSLGISLGIGVEATERLAGIRQALDEGEAEHAPTVTEMLRRFGAEAPDGVRLAVASKIDQPDPG